MGENSNNAVDQSMSAILQYLIQASRRPSPGPPNLSCLQVSPPATFTVTSSSMEFNNSFALKSLILGLSHIPMTLYFTGTKGISTISLDTSIGEQGTTLIIGFLAEQIPQERFPD